MVNGRSSVCERTLQGSRQLRGRECGHHATTMRAMPGFNVRCVRVERSPGTRMSALDRDGTDEQQADERTESLAGVTMKPTRRLHELGQSLWLDNITRDLLDSG